MTATKPLFSLKSLAKPFVKWAGGKSQLLGQLESLFPKDFNNYIEPMVGGGAVFFHLFNTTRLKQGAILIDINPELMNCYEVIKNSLKALIVELKKLESLYVKVPKETYYKVRKWDRKKNFHQRSKIERAARTIFLNKTCYNGLYRVNSKGQFNVPFGKYNNPTIRNDQGLKAVSIALRNVILITDDFEKCLETVSLGDFIYFDPPYYPLSETASFTSYTKQDFKKEDQERLRNVFAKLAKRGCKVMLSNSDTKFINNLYQDFNIYKVYAKRYINSNPYHRGTVTELVVTNY